MFAELMQYPAAANDLFTEKTCFAWEMVIVQVVIRVLTSLVSLQAEQPS